jgi:hypothetical protein
MSNRFAVIEDGVVVNVVIGAPAIADNQICVECDTAGPGWKYIDGQFVEPDPVPTITPTPTKEELLAQLQAIQAQISNLL